MSKIFKKPPHCKDIEDHQKYLSRITKTLYYGKLPKNETLSLPLTEMAAEIFSEAQKGKSIDRLHINTAAQISREACVSPCSLVLAILCYERLRRYNTDYLDRTAPSDLFLVSLMVSSKFLFDDGEVDQVFMDEWATSSGLTCKELIQLERDFLEAIDWKIYANELTFWKKLGQIEMYLAFKEGKSRGYFTYTELETLADMIGKDFQIMVQYVVSISVILAALYTASFLLLVGSVALASKIPGTSLYYSKNGNQNDLPIEHGVLLEDKEAVIPPTLNLIKDTNTNAKHNNTLNLNAIKVLKASILLASIKTEESTNFPKSKDEKCENCQGVSWDWWNVPVMNWLSKASEYIKSFEVPEIRNYIYFLENTVTNGKLVYLEDHIRKATKTRIQDQLERSWHAEWTDTIKCHVSHYSILPYLQSIKP